MDFKQQYKSELENELTQFLFLCGKKNGKILMSKAKRNDVDEYVRLACIAIVFGYKKLLLKIIAHTQKFFDEFMKGLKNIGGNFFKIDEWTTEFINNIATPDAQKLARDFWAERKEFLDINNFNIRQLLK